MTGAGRSSRGWRVAGPIMDTLMMALGPSAEAERAPMAQSDTTARDARGTIKGAALLLYQPYSYLVDVLERSFLHEYPQTK